MSDVRGRNNSRSCGGTAWLHERACSAGFRSLLSLSLSLSLACLVCLYAPASVMCACHAARHSAPFRRTQGVAGGESSARCGVNRAGEGFHEGDAFNARGSAAGKGERGKRSKQEEEEEKERLQRRKAALSLTPRGGQWSARHRLLVLPMLSLSLRPACDRDSAHGSHRRDRQSSAAP
jgi:hypothetical protein